MVEEKQLRISEYFTTIQGEGPRAGVPSNFIRLWGCNLKCTFCDTKFSRETNEDGRVNWTWELASCIIDCFRHPCFLRNDFVITGGEPFLQWTALADLVLKIPKDRVYIETNGTLFHYLAQKAFPQYVARRLQRKIIPIVSPKGPLPEVNRWTWFEEVYLKIVLPQKGAETLKKMSKYIQPFLQSQIPHENIYIMPKGVTPDEVAKSVSKIMPIIMDYNLKLSPRHQISYYFK